MCLISLKCSVTSLSFKASINPPLFVYATSLCLTLPQEVTGASDFNWPVTTDRFYNPHHARQVIDLSSADTGGRNITLLRLFDNGNARPMSEGGPFSRALELELDFDSFEARYALARHFVVVVFGVFDAISRQIFELSSVMNHFGFAG